MSIVQSATGAMSPSTVLATASDWRGAAKALIAFLVANGRCFSSGEVAAYLRTYRSDLAFQVSSLGLLIRDMYDDGEFPSYDVAGAPVYPTQVPRTTNGVAVTLDGRKVHSRTTPGTAVFVYAPDAVEGFAHDFEVYIPEWNDPKALKAADYAGPPPAATQTPTSATPGAPQPPTAQAALVITGALPGAPSDGVCPDGVTAVCIKQSDHGLRIFIPRAAFNAYIALTGSPIRGGKDGDPVYATFLHDGTGGTARPVIEITRDKRPDAAEYHLWKDRGQLAVKPADGFGPFQQDQRFKVTVTAAAITVHLA